MTLRRLVPSLALAFGLTSSAAARAEPEASAPDAASDGFLARRGYLHIAPGVVSLDLDSRVVPHYVWGLGFGGHWSVSRELMIEFGAFFEHVLEVTDGPSRNLFGFGPEVRLGGGARRIFGYGLVRLGPTIARVRTGPGPAADPGAHVFHHPALLCTFGGGFQGLLGRHAALGVEPAFDVVAAGDGALGSFRLRLFLAVLF